ncbi:MAG: dTMP kinase [Chloroflexota bacterium]
MALFITFEGGEGSGKSVQAKALYRKMVRLNIPAVFTHEPGGTPLGEKLARWLKWSQGQYMSPLAELLIFNASRTQLIEEVIQPGLNDGKVVICDRYVDSTIAYQGYGRGLDLAMVEAVTAIATRGIKPDLTVLLDLPVEEGLARKRKQKPDRFEQEEIDFHQRVRQGFLKLAESEPDRWLVIDARQSRAKIAGIIWERVHILLAAQ